MFAADFISHSSDSTKGEAKKRFQRSHQQKEIKCDERESFYFNDKRNIPSLHKCDGMSWGMFRELRRCGIGN